MLSEARLFYDFEQLCIYLSEATANDNAIILQNPPSSIFYMGLTLIEKMLNEAGCLYPKAKLTFVLDCGDDAAITVMALQRGFKQIKYLGSALMVEKIRKIAENYNATIF